MVPYSYYGATDVHTNVDDLARWMRFLAGAETLGSADAVRRLTERVNFRNGATQSYALGLFLSGDGAATRWNHGGSTAGYRTAFGYYPHLDAGVLVLGNTAALDAGGVAEATAEAFFGAEIGAPDDGAAADGPTPPAADPVDAERLAARVGAYWVDGRGLFTVGRAEDGGLTLETPRGRSGPLVPVGPTSLWFEPEVSLHFAADAVDRSVLRIEGTGDLPMRRVEPEPAPDLAAYVGRFHSPEAGASYTIALEDGGLVLHHRRLGALPLRAAARDIFRATWPLSELVFERSAGGRVTGFRATDGRCLGVAFRRVDWWSGD